jgi:uncharacterized coiled-coil protein SlyX
VTSLDSTDLADRLAAVERRLTDGESDPAADAAAVEARVSELEARADELDDRLAGVESGLDSLRGLVGEVERVDDRVERRADAALAVVEDLEERVAALESAGESDAELARAAARQPPDPTRYDDPVAAEAGVREQTDPQSEDRSLLSRLRDVL